MSDTPGQGSAEATPDLAKGPQSSSDEAERRQRAYARWADQRRRVDTLLYAIALLLLITFGGNAIVEIVSRNTMAALFRTETLRLQALLAQDPGRGSDAAGSGPVSTTADTVRMELTMMQAALFEFQALSAIGSINRCSRMLLPRSIMDTRRPSSMPCQGQVFLSGVHQVLHDQLPYNIDMWSDEGLFLVLAICSGAIGALIAGLRTVQFTLFRDLALGFASGFIVYLAMKGGRHVFLMSATDGPTLLNPYAYAFAGILVGLFTERAYGLLSSLIDELERRLKGAVSTPPPASPPKPPGT